MRIQNKKGYNFLLIINVKDLEVEMLCKHEKNTRSFGIEHNAV